MSFALWSILLVSLMPLVWVAVAKSGASGYDNERPRPWLEKLHGWPQRAAWAQQNAYEALPPYAAGVIVATITGANPLVIDVLAGIFLVMRVAHGLAYITNRSTLRSLVWVIGFFCTIAMFVVAGWE